MSDPLRPEGEYTDSDLPLDAEVSTEEYDEVEDVLDDDDDLDDDEVEVIEVVETDDDTRPL